MALVLIFGNNRLCVTTWVKISLVIDCLFFFTKKEIVAALVSNWCTIGSVNTVIEIP
jgi:hypothetical protein